MSWPSQFIQLPFLWFYDWKWPIPLKHLDYYDKISYFVNGKLVIHCQQLKGWLIFLMATNSSSLLTDVGGVQTCCLSGSWDCCLVRVVLCWWLVPEALLEAMEACTDGLVMVLTAIWSDLWMDLEGVVVLKELDYSLFNIFNALTIFEAESDGLKKGSISILTFQDEMRHIRSLMYHV